MRRRAERVVLAAALAVSVNLGAFGQGSEEPDRPGAAGGDSAALQAFLKEGEVAPFWVYDSLEDGLARAVDLGLPLLVTIRCVPCKACRGMDDAVVNPTDGGLRELMSQFVCVRLVQAWGLDLTLFQYDMNQSWTAFMINTDRVIYGRYGTRAAQRDASAITVPGFKAALRGALELHRAYGVDPAEVARRLASKTGPEPRWPRPEDSPVIRKTVRFKKSFGRLTGDGRASCVHCHFVAAADMVEALAAGEDFTDRDLWAYPLPEDIGLTLDPGQRATVTAVEPDTPAARAGLRPGDVIRAIEGTPMLSVADIQWALHRAGDPGRLGIWVDRGGRREGNRTLELPAGWRRRGEFVERVSSWDFFKVKIFGVAQMTPLAAGGRAEHGVADGGMALRVDKLTPSWGDMNHDARRAGLEAGDVVVAMDGNDKTGIGSHSGFLAYLLQKKRDGQTLGLTVSRRGARRTIEVPLRWAGRLGALRTP